jgi:hypothetical protein
MTALTLRRFAGFTPYNAADRIRDRRERGKPSKCPPWMGWLHYGPITGRDLFLATSHIRCGYPYRAGDAGRGTLRRHKGRLV